MNFRYQILIFILFFGIMSACVELYQQPDVDVKEKYLVVEGFLNYSDTTKIQLSYTRNLNNSIPEFESEAIVEIQSKSNLTFPLINSGNGVYKALLKNLDIKEQYRLSIQTSSQSFLSDYVLIKLSPEIDSITWIANEKGVDFSVTTHDIQNNTNYYRWNYLETWEYHTPYKATLTYNPLEPDVLMLLPKQIFLCWNSRKSRNILLGSSRQLTNDVIFKKLLGSIPYSNYEFSDKYSMLVSQQALSKEAFEYWNDVQKNSNGTGTLFSPQPSQVASNIILINNDNKTVVGFFYATSVETKRIFIEQESIHFKLETINCDFPPKTLSPREFIDDSYLPYSPVPDAPLFNAYPKRCLDCRVQGGINTKPDFWID